MSLKTAWADCWYRSCAWLYLFAPVAGLFVFLSGLRRLAYRRGFLGSTRLPVPVIVVGNITAGGTGKTPLVLWLVEMLRRADWHPGVLSRGYGAANDAPRAVDAHGDPAAFGDEPLLLARRAACPVWVGRHRAEVGRALLATHPEIDVLVCDDGLQHYALARDVEVAVIDGERGLGNGWRLPVGPLREPAARLGTVDAVVVNGPVGAGFMHAGAFAMHLEPGRFVNVRDPGTLVDAAYFLDRSVHAVAGIGNPERFFSSLSALGIDARPRGFPDHHVYRAQDLPKGEVLMTEKDAVKCAGLGRNDLWALGVDARVDDGLQSLILAKLKSHHGQQTA
jgi:tetraacyldisaccharide 4'-kinase